MALVNRMTLETPTNSTKKRVLSYLLFVNKRLRQGFNVYPGKHLDCPGIGFHVSRDSALVGDDYVPSIRPALWLSNNEHVVFSRLAYKTVACNPRGRVAK